MNHHISSILTIAGLATTIIAPSAAIASPISATTDAAVYGGATPGIESSVTLDLRTDVSTATGGTSGKIAYIEFSLDPSTISQSKSAAQLDLFIKRANAGVAYTLYGLNDAATFDNGWSPSDLSASSSAINAPGTLSSLDANSNPAIDPAQVTLLGTITALPSLSGYTDLSITDTTSSLGTFTPGNQTLSQFLSADTNGSVTFLLVPTARGDFLGNAYTASGGAYTEQLSFTASTANAVPEPASLSIAGLGLATLLTRRRR